MSDRESSLHKRRHGVNRLVLGALFASFFIVAFWDTVFVAIKSGEQGVFWSRFYGGTSERILGEGTQLKFPWDEITIYSTRIQTVSQTDNMLTRDGLQVALTWALRFHLKPKRIPEFQRIIGPNYIRTNIVPQCISVFREVVGNHTAEDIYTLPEHVLLDEIEKVIATKAFRSGRIIRDEIFLLALDLPEKMESSIVEKLISEQKMLSYRYRLRTEEDERKRREIEAKGIRAFEDIARISILKWQAIDATRELGKSPNAKIIFMGPTQNSLPVLLNADPSAPREQRGLHENVTQPESQTSPDIAPPSARIEPRTSRVPRGEPTP